MSPEMMLHTGPPPQIVLDQRWLWKIMLVGFCLLFALQMIATDVVGSMLTCMLLGFAVLMIRDGMQDMPKYALLYATLCALNFVFDMLPLLKDFEFGGRVHRTKQLVSPSMDVHGSETTTYMLTTKTTPFFDQSLGLAYNAASASLFLEPVCMLMGAYLAASAHSEFQRVMSSADDDWGEISHGGQFERSVGQGPGNTISSIESGRETSQRFFGQAFKLDGSNVQP